MHYTLTHPLLRMFANRIKIIQTFIHMSSQSTQHSDTLLLHNLTTSQNSTLFPSTNQSISNEDTSVTLKWKSEIKYILVTMGVISLPLFIFSTSLIGLVFSYQIKHIESSSSFLNHNIPKNEPGVYYVRISSTTLALLASLSSSIAPALVGFVMTLNSYIVSHRILNLKDDKRSRHLPTPYQLVLLVNLLNGTIAALWQWIKYAFRWRTVRVVNNSAWILSALYVLVYQPFPPYVFPDSHIDLSLSLQTRGYI